jgi:hypothetical protein
VTLAVRTWSRIRRRLRRQAGAVKRRMTGRSVRRRSPTAGGTGIVHTAVASGRPLDVDLPVRLLIGPANMAGQGLAVGALGRAVSPGCLGGIADGRPQPVWLRLQN